MIKGFLLLYDAEALGRQAMRDLRHHEAEASRIRRDLGISEVGKVLARENISVDDIRIGHVEAVADGFGDAVVTEYMDGNYCGHYGIERRLAVPEKEAAPLVAVWMQERVAAELSDENVEGTI